jgi:hypothetical protein
MKCKIKQGSTQTWELNPEVLDQVCQKTGTSIYNAMYDKVEYASTFVLHHKLIKSCTKRQKGHGKGCQIANLHMAHLNRGSSTSVKTEDGLCNFHTHPIDCYLREETVWGWPSGEDMRETVCFMLRGNLVHFVFTLEGIYMIRVNPSMMQALYDLKTSNERGVVLSLIETCFKSTHGFRNVDYNARQHDHLVMPNDWIKFCNSFRLKNIISKSGLKDCSSRLPCHGIPNYSRSDNNGKHFTFQQYLKYFKVEPYALNKQGRISHGKWDDVKASDYLLDNIHKLQKHFEQPKYQSNQTGFKPGQWFQCTYYENCFYVPDHQQWLTTTNLVKHLCKATGGQEVAKYINATWKQLQQHPQKRLFRFYPKVIRFKGHAFHGEECKTK